MRTHTKWHCQSNAEIKIGILIIIKEDMVPPLQWHTERIITIHPGQDNVIRIATVKTVKGLVK